MGDPRFERTVILMVRHDKDGAFGIVVNRPAGERPLAELIQMLGEKDAAVAGKVRIFAGGPVQPDGGCPESTAEQARRCWEIVLAARAEAGASVDDVVRTRTFLTPAAWR